MKTLLLAVALATLAACAATPEELAARDHADCVGYGFTPATPDYAQCRLTVAQNRETRANARRAAYFAGAGARPVTVYGPGNPAPY